MTRRFSSISVQTALATGISNTALVVPVATGTGAALMGGVTLAGGNVDQFSISMEPNLIGAEIMRVTGISGDNLTVLRGQDGTSAIAHSAGAVIQHVIAASDLVYFTTAATPTGDLANTGLPFPGSTSGTTTVKATAIAGVNTLTLPATTSDTLVGQSTVDNLANKTLIDPKIIRAINAQVGTTYTLVLTDVSKEITISNASPVSLLIPTNALVAIPVGTIVRVLNKGAGLLTISAVTPGTTTVTSTGIATAAPTVKANGAVNLTQIAADTWAVSGDVDAQVLTNKTLTSPVINTPTGIVKGDVGLGNVDNTSDVTKNAATVTLTNKTLTLPVINAPIGIVKGDVGLGSVDNTSDVTKNAATVALTNKDLSSGTNTFPASLATLTGTQTVTGKTMAYGSNTFTGFPSGFTAPTIGSTIVNSGATVASISGLTLVTPVLTAPIETVNIVGAAPTATQNIDLITSAVWYFTTNATNNFVLNFRGSAGTTLNTLIAIGQSITVAVRVSNAVTTYYMTSLTIDGGANTPFWAGGTAPTTGDASAKDLYTFVILKTANATFDVTASMTKVA